jgi:predicted unusual protein kinase regulating ubiquinone biosynthesis (AarF/ABC1/UbiB family)
MVKTLTLFGTPGKKFAQLAGLWNLFPRETARLNRVKDNAGPLEKLEILKILEKELLPEDFAKIDYVEKVLGSASIKTSVRLRLRDGSSVVASVVNPDAEGQIRTHFATVRMMLPKLRAAGVPGVRPATERAIDLAEAQALAELDMIAEASKVDQIDLAVRKLTAEMKDRLGQWKVDVPQVSSSFKRYKGVLFTELAQGETLNRLPDTAQTREAGKLAAEMIVALAFRAGLVVSDPHRGNMIVDLIHGQPTLHLIDHAQNIELSLEETLHGDDDVSRLARFLLALKGENASQIAEAGAELSKTPATPPQIHRLTQAIQHALNEKREVGELLLKMNQEFSDAGVPIEDRFSFNMLKAFTTLLQENYVSSQELTNLLAHEVTGHVLRNFLNPQFIDKCRKYFGTMGALL